MIPRRSPAAGSARGFGLVEMLVVALLTTIIMTLVLFLHADAMRRRASQARKVEMLQTGRAVLDLMVREMRQAGHHGPLPVSFTDEAPLLTCEDEAIRFQSDLPRDANEDGDTVDVVDANLDGDTRDDDENENGDGVLNDANEDLEYVLDGRRLVRIETDATSDEITSSAVLSDAVNSLLFEYRLADGSLIETPIQSAALRRQVASVRIELTMESFTPDAVLSRNLSERTHELFTIESEVQLRNR